MTYDIPFHERTITELAVALRAGETTSEALTQHFLDRIETFDQGLGAFRLVCPERALNEARTADAERRAGHDRGMLHGVPYAAKDLFDVAGLPTTAGTPLMADNVVQHDATVVARLCQAGMVLLGKTNTVQLAFGAVGINHHYGTPHNPWQAEHHVPGGSSSGSAVAVAAGLAPMALGSDTGGSVRIPASLCGTTGLKTTVGRVSRAGVFPLSWTLDSVGLLTRSAEDAAHVLGVIGGADLNDSTTAGRLQDDVLATMSPSLHGIRLAFAASGFSGSADQEIVSAVRDTADVLSDLGAEVSQIEFALADDIRQLECAKILVGAEARVSNEQLMRDSLEALDPVVRERLKTSRDISATQYLRTYATVLQQRARMARELEEFDALLLPTTIVPARPLDDVDRDLDTYFDYNSTVLTNTTLGNVLDLCGVSVPCGWNARGLPIGLLINGKPFCESLVLKVAHAYQHVTDRHRRCPDLSWSRSA